MTPPLPFDIILASGSPRRREFLQMLGLPFIVQTADIDETPQPGEAPDALVCRLSRQKAEAVSAQNPQSLIIAADTIVAQNGHILGKPIDAADAKSMLLALSGESHFVHSAITLLRWSPREEKTTLNSTMVTMRHLAPAEIDAYIASGDPMDKAGAYAIQNADFSPVARLDGCFAGVMGFPLRDFAASVSAFGVELPDIATNCATFIGQPCCLQEK